MKLTKSKKGKRLLGIVLSCAMVFSMLPGIATAADGSPTAVTLAFGNGIGNSKTNVDVGGVNISTNSLASVTSKNNNYRFTASSSSNDATFTFSVPTSTSATYYGYKISKIVIAGATGEGVTVRSSGSNGWSNYQYGTDLTWTGTTLESSVAFSIRKDGKNGKGRLSFSSVTVYLVNPVTGIEIEESLSLSEGATSPLTATITPTTATYRSVTWASSNTAVATVDSNGVVTAVSSGTAIITALAANGTTATGDDVTSNNCTVTVTPLPTGISLDKTSLTMEYEDESTPVTETLTATLTPDNATSALTWTSSNDAVATVDEDGVVTAHSAGTATITVTTVNDLSATCTVEVVQLPTGVTLDQTSVSLERTTSSPTARVNATVAPSGVSTTLTWTSSDESVATVRASQRYSNQGVITGVGAGTATITVTTANGKSATCAVTVTQLPTGVTIEPSTLTLERESTDVTSTLTATLAPSDATTTLTWSSNRTSVATVDQNGVVTAHSAGTATITVRTSNGKSATCTVTVVQLPTGVTLDQTSVSLERTTTNPEARVNATVAPSGVSTTLTWTSSDESVATVRASRSNSRQGVITGVGAGTATITVTTANGKSATCTVTVTQLPTGISLNASELSLVADCGTSTLTATVAPDTTTDPSVTWTSSDPSVATVVDGVVTPLAAGETTITATTVNNLTASCTVTVSPVATGITIPESLTLYRTSDPEQMTYTIVPDGATYGDLVWTSDNEDVATVDQNGVVTPVGVGTAKISVSATYEGHTAYSNACTVNVFERVDGVTIIPDTLSLTVGGETGTLSITLDPALDNYTAVWSSDNESVATVADGVVTPVAAGTAIITVAVYDEGTGDPITATCTVTVTEPNPDPEPTPDQEEEQEPVLTYEQITRMTVTNFVERLYLETLNRNYDYAGRESWVEQLMAGGSASQVAWGFFNSQEFLNRALTNEQFVTILYKVYFDRTPDEEGFNNWVTALNNGATRDEVIAGFAGSEEWASFCARYRVVV